MQQTYPVISTACGQQFGITVFLKYHSEFQVSIPQITQIIDYFIFDIRAQKAL